ncbi:MAG: Ig-like domain-containing protein [Deltaproteobacteria bacterium]|nr:Ig-like domain-containing protein [Deltaproteobacteria bacterium]
MRPQIFHRRSAKLFPAIAILALLPAFSAQAASWTLVGWNNLGMHCMDDDFAIFSLLPPYNTIHAQLTDTLGNLVVDPAAQGITVTYEAVADPSGSINTTSNGKTNFWDHVFALFGASVPADAGLAGKGMPGAGNTPQPMSFDAASQWFIAEGIPITPYDDGGRKNYYPMMHLVARSSLGAVLATTDIVLPVSDEMDCKSCHSSGSGPAAKPNAGWVFDADAKRDVRLNIVRLHDEKQAGDPTFSAALAAMGYNPAGLFTTATTDGHAVLCAGCHSSPALGTAGQPGVMQFTSAMHGLHAAVSDPTNGLTLDSSSNRSACYRCHPGSVTRCLRGAMGAAVAADGTLAMQCQSCHGSMSAVGSTSRTGWLDEPACQSCHTGTAVNNNGQIRYTSVFDSPGHRRVPANQTFATTANAPAPGLSLFRFSTGHGGIKCEGCHGSTHAEFPALHENDNVQSIQHQGHVGVLVECTTCHGQQPSTVSGGPHGMHPLGSTWVSQHSNAVENGGASQCRACHGTDYRGTVLSRSQADRLLYTELGAKYFWRGFQVGCYTCHNGPSGGDGNSNRPPVAANASVVTDVNTPITIHLNATDADHNALTLRIVSQSNHGSVGLTGTQALYTPDPGFTGIDTFTFAAWDGSTDSNLATVAVTVGLSIATPTPSPGGSTSTPTAIVPTPTPTPTTIPLCPPTPQSGCRTGQRASLWIKRDVAGKRDALRFSLTKGQSSALADFGNPMTSTAFALCVYDASGAVEAVRVPPGGMCGRKPCWKTTAGASYAYADRNAAHDGITRILLHSSAAAASKLVVWGKGDGLPAPRLPLQGAVTAQVTATNGMCFEADFAVDSVRKNDGIVFKAALTVP